eukprot:6210122-Pleurochrysis_carterae.AAC.4
MHARCVGLTAASSLRGQRAARSEVRIDAWPAPVLSRSCRAPEQLRGETGFTKDVEHDRQTLWRKGWACV